MPPESQLRVGVDGFVYADGVKLPAKFIAERGVLQFVDKDRRSVSRRGTRFVEVPVTDVARLGTEKTKNAPA